MKKINLKDLKESAIYVTPHLPIMHTKRYKFSLLSAFFYLSLFIIIMWIIIIIILAVTPLKDYVFVLENDKIIEQSVKISELEHKVGFLRNELESIASTNKKLKYALILGTLDSNNTIQDKEKKKIYDTLKKNRTQNKRIEGNILAGLVNFVNFIFTNDEQADNTTFRLPVKGYIITIYEPENGHFGIDFGVKSGTAVYASSSGLVIFADYISDDGYTIIIQHSEGYISIYKHLSACLKRQREFVEQGELIALSGNTGYNTSGAHLHFEIWKDGKVVDPQKLIINN
ncbi:MAG: M23 family metallopeptidase [bacterium]